VVVGAAGFELAKHQGNDTVHKEVAAGLEKGQRQLSMERCPWKKEADD
jgi:hypothetical protein